MCEVLWRNWIRGDNPVGNLITQIVGCYLTTQHPRLTAPDPLFPFWDGGVNIVFLLFCQTFVSNYNIYIYFVRMLYNYRSSNWYVSLIIIFAIYFRLISVETKLSIKIPWILYLVRMETTCYICLPHGRAMRNSVHIVSPPPIQLKMAGLPIPEEPARWVFLPQYMMWLISRKMTVIKSFHVKQRQNQLPLSNIHLRVPLLEHNTKW